MLDLTAKFTFSDLIPYLRSEFAAHQFFMQFSCYSSSNSRQYKTNDSIPCPNNSRGCIGGHLKRALRIKKRKDGSEKIEEYYKCEPLNPQKRAKKGCIPLGKACRGRFNPKNSPAISSLKTLYEEIRNSQLHSNQILLLVFCWSVQLTAPQLQCLLGFNRLTLYTWGSLFRRRVCHQLFIRRNQLVGQLGHDGIGDVQVDETLLLGHRKYRRGRILMGDHQPGRILRGHGLKQGSGRRNYGNRMSGLWVFGLCWRKPDATDGGKMKVVETRMFVVKKRSRKVLIPIIQREVAPGMTIMSDEWQAYKGLSSIGYRHITVNHNKKQFKDPITGANIGSISCQWSLMKTWYMRQMRGSSNFNRESYMSEYWWRSINRKAGNHPFLAFCRDLHLLNGL